MRTEPTVEMLRSGLWTVPVPIPDHPLRYTASYLLDDGEHTVLIDPGWSSEQGWSALRQGLHAAGTDVTSIAGIVITHAHPDHHGLAAKVREASGAWIAMHPLEAPQADARGGADPDLRRINDVAILREDGVPDDVVSEIAHDEKFFSTFEPTPVPDLLLEDGERVPLRHRKVRVVWTPGHAPGHICLYDADADVFLSGDHVLPRITPQIFDQPQSKASALGDYLASLDRVAAYDTAEVLPAHEYRFRGLARRSAELIRHHEARLAEIESHLRACGAATAWSITTSISWSRGWNAVEGRMRRVALGETVAHLNYLLKLGRLRSRRPHADDARYYELAEGAPC